MPTRFFLRLLPECPLTDYEQTLIIRHGRGVLELTEDHDGNTYRAVYTVRFARVVYVLHAFQKKSRGGIATPKGDIDLIKKRLAAAERHDAQRLKEHKT